MGINKITKSIVKYLLGILKRFVTNSFIMGYAIGMFIVFTVLKTPCEAMYNFGKFLLIWTVVCMIMDSIPVILKFIDKLMNND